VAAACEPPREGREVVVVAEELAESLRPLDEGLDRARPAVGEQPVVVPEVLDALTPLVQALGRRILLGGSEGVAAAAIRALGSGTQ
jgi:hypothetical protein